MHNRHRRVQVRRAYGDGSRRHAMSDEYGDEMRCCRCCTVPDEPDQCAFGGQRDSHAGWCPVCHPEKASGPDIGFEDVPW